LKIKNFRKKEKKADGKRICGGEKGICGRGLDDGTWSRGAQKSKNFAEGGVRNRNLQGGMARVGLPGEKEAGGNAGEGGKKSLLVKEKKRGGERKRPREACSPGGMQYRPKEEGALRRGKWEMSAGGGATSIQGGVGGREKTCVAKKR